MPANCEQKHYKKELIECSFFVGLNTGVYF
jgi:hypothetical protein